MIRRNGTQFSDVLAAVNKRFQGDLSFYKSITGVFLKTTRENIENIRHAIKNDDMEKIRFSAHYIKGGAANIGAEEIREIAAKIESMEKDVISVRLESLLQAVETEMKRLNDFISGS
ncbi:hypothetical protein GF337_00925 [candidate division KSB1 bacterium]|nr:hypothetical protein [candidate division KSB1 bacterium]